MYDTYAKMGVLAFYTTPSEAPIFHISYHPLLTGSWAHTATILSERLLLTYVYTFTPAILEEYLLVLIRRANKVCGTR